MGTAKTTVILDADETKLLDAYRNSTAAEKKAALETEKGNKATKDKTKSIDKMRASWGKAIMAGMGIASVTAALKTGVDWLKEYDRSLATIADKQKNIGSSIMEFSAMQPEGKVKENREKATRIIRDSGAVDTLEDGFKVAVAAQAATPGDFEDAIPNIKASLDMAKFTGEPETAAALVATAEALKMSVEELNAVVVGSSEDSSKSPKDFSRAAPFWTKYTDEGDPNGYFGAASTHALTKGGIQAEQLPTYTKAFGEALTSVEDPMQKSIKGFKEMTLLQRSEAIRAKVKAEYGSITTETLQQAGMGNKEQAFAAATVLRDDIWGNNFLPTLSAAKDYKNTHSLQKLIEEKTNDDPLIEFMEDSRVTSLGLEEKQISGAEGDRARKIDYEKKAAVVESGYAAWAVNQDTGEPTYFARMLSELKNRGNNTMYAPRAGTYGKDRFDNAMREQAAREKSEAATKELVGALKETTAAIKDSAPSRRPPLANRNAGLEP